MQMLPRSILGFLLVIPVFGITLGLSVRAERQVSPSFLEEAWNPFQGKSLPQGIENESLTIGRLIAEQADPVEWPAKRIRDLSLYIVLKSREYQVSPLLVLSLIHVESSFRMQAVSPKGAVGLMQLMPATAQELANSLGLPLQGREALADPKVNIKLGLHYIRHLRRRFPDQEHMLTAYNMGPNALEKKLQNGEDFSVEYAQKVMEAMNTYKKRSPSVRIRNKTWL